MLGGRDFTSDLLLFDVTDDCVYIHRREISGPKLTMRDYSVAIIFLRSW